MIFLLLDGNEKPNEKPNEKSNEKSNETKPNQKPSGGKIGKCLQGTCQILQTKIFKKGYFIFSRFIIFKSRLSPTAYIFI